MLLGYTENLIPPYKNGYRRSSENMWRPDDLPANYNKSDKLKTVCPCGRERGRESGYTAWFPFSFNNRPH
jgi:hypothetical protein